MTTARSGTMPLDGLTLKVLVDELHSRLKNGRVIKIYQPNELTITIHLRLPGTTEILLISADPLHPRIHTIEVQPPNPLNPPAFCMLLRKHLEPSRLLAVEQQGWDRLVHLRFECPDERGQLTERTLVLEVMGRHSNLFLTSQGGQIMDALKRFPEKEIAPGYAYQTPSDQGKQDPTALTAEEFINEVRLLPPPTLLWKWIQDSFQGFSKVAAQEVLRRGGFAPHGKRLELEAQDWAHLYETYRNLLEELEQGGHPRWYPELGDFAAYTLTSFKGEDFTSTDGLIGSVFSKKVQTRQIEQKANALRKQLHNPYKRVLKKEILQLETLAEAEGADQWRHQGELLTASFHLIPTGQASVQVPDYSSPDQSLVTIELDPRLSPSVNVQRIFRRYNKAKSSKKFTQVQLEKTREERRYLEDVLLQIELADDQLILEEIARELNSLGYLKKQTKTRGTKTSPSRGPERYLSADGLTILVGRNNQQNDELTFRLSSPNHLWLHARNIPGSHVVILAEGEIPDATLSQGAHLAAYFSQSRTSPKVAVDYTLRRHVRKPKGAKPGFVHYDQAKTILVNPTEFTLPPKA